MLRLIETTRTTKKTSIFFGIMAAWESAQHFKVPNKVKPLE